MTGGDTVKSSPTPASSRPTTATQTTGTRTVPSETPGNVTSGNRRETRATPPSSLPAELMLKFNTQVGRITALRALQESLPQCASNLSIEELKVYVAQVDEIHKAFLKEHAYFELTWPATHLNHNYFTQNMHLTESRLCLNIKLTLSRFKKELEIVQPRTSQGSTAAPGNLPAISLPLKGASFKPERDLLSEMCQNKRILVQSQLDKLFSAKRVLARSAAALTQLISTVEEAQTSLQSLGVDASLGDCILVHQVARNLDKVTRAAWEASVGLSQEYPTFKQVREFVNGKARALEAAENPTPHSAPRKLISTGGKVTKKRASVHRASHPYPEPKDYPCDCCGADHYIVVCPRFRRLTVQQRRKVIANNMLCCNCCGRHSASNCKSSYRCKQCGLLHHTMLHVQQA